MLAAIPRGGKELDRDGGDDGGRSPACVPCVSNHPLLGKLILHGAIGFDEVYMAKVEAIQTEEDRLAAIALLGPFIVSIHLAIVKLTMEDIRHSV